jgi:hypothetical protein
MLNDKIAKKIKKKKKMLKKIRKRQKKKKKSPIFFSCTCNSEGDKFTP